MKQNQLFSQKFNDTKEKKMKNKNKNKINNEMRHWKYKLYRKKLQNINIQNKITKPK